MEDNGQDPSLESRWEAFERWLIVDRDLARSTARMRANIVRKELRNWGTLNPSKEQVQRTKEDYVMGGCTGCPLVTAGNTQDVSTRFRLHDGG